MPRNKKKSSVSGGEITQLISLLQGMQTARAPPKRKPRRKNRPKQSSAVKDGQITLNRTELVATVQLAASKATVAASLDLVPSSFPFLTGISTHFDRVRWNSMKISYRPAVGTVYGGLITVGVDWDSNSKIDSRSKAAVLTPNFTTALWSSTESRPMVLPKDRLMTRNWYTPSSSDSAEKGPGRIWYVADGKSDSSVQTLGELWISYSVVMEGTNPS